MNITQPTASKAPSLTSFVALIERPLHGGADRVLRVSVDNAELRAEARKLTVVGDSVAYLVEECVPLVIRLAHTDRYLRARSLDLHAAPLRVFMSSESAEAWAAVYQAADCDTVIEPLTREVSARYPSLEVHK